MAMVGVVIGSKTDEPYIQHALKILEEFKIDYELSIVSAHRKPEKVRQYAIEAKAKGFLIIIAAAGSAAHLPGVIASWTTLPVIGVPLPTSELKGVDSLYSIVQMPGGVPVACVGIGASGAKNAALLAAQILGIKYENIHRTFEEYKTKLAES
ncbi:MAG: 5-(carboxyamino)imidazole ribonucleotide mutase [Dehalococcoidia bacterium]|nr:5-(carboxyamino)imidazole ribonucleotide mutase [Dehalococcoidia bacterium]MDD5493392.1 5-(carboxyamino)imidazole ribonucleotide mutase [Dehalococcoidia bacterium]